MKQGHLACSFIFLERSFGISSRGSLTLASSERPSRIVMCAIASPCDALLQCIYRLWTPIRMCVFIVSEQAHVSIVYLGPEGSGSHFPGASSVCLS